MADKVLAAYISQYGTAPTQADHLLKFSRSRTDVPTLNYGSARKAMSEYQQKQKYESIKYGTKKPKPNKPKSPITKKYTITPKTHRTPNRNPNRSPPSSPIAISLKTTPVPSPVSSNSSSKRNSIENRSRNEPIITINKRKKSHSDTIDVATLDDSKNDIELSTNDRKHKSIVIDNGTSLLKIGYVGDKKPISMFHPTQISNGRILSKNPIERGIVKDLYKIEDVYKHAFRNVLSLSDDELTEYGVIMNCAAFNPRQTAEELCELMMETFNVKQFFISSAAVFSLYAVQKVSGLVIESGGGLTQCVPIWNGCPVAQACKRIDVGGNDIDEYLFDLLKSKYKNMQQIDMKICRQIKEKYGYIAIDYRKESAKKIEFSLPDGTVIKIGDERFKCGELLFSYLSRNGVDKQIFDSIMNCDMDIRKQLFGNIVISGGTMAMKGVKNRLNNELIQLCKASKIKKTQKYSKKIQIVAHKNRDILSWLGGSIFGSLPAFEEMWYTREQYQEHGSNMTTRIENNNIFFYDEYSPKEVDLKEIQNYNQTYRRRTISVYSHKNSITTIDPIYNASSAYSGMSIGINKHTQINKKNSLEIGTNIKIEPWNDNNSMDIIDDMDDDVKDSNNVHNNNNNDEPWNDIDEIGGINGQIEPKKKHSKSKRRKNSNSSKSKKKSSSELDARDEAIQSFLLQIEEISLENNDLKQEIEKLKQENKFYKHNEKKIESEKAKLQTEKVRLENLKNEIKVKSAQLKREISMIQQLFNNGNHRLQQLNVDFLSNDTQIHIHKNTKIEPIND